MPVPRRGNSLQRDKLTRLKARLEELDAGVVTSSHPKKWRAALVMKIQDLESKGIEPLEHGSLPFSNTSRRRSAA